MTIFLEVLGQIEARLKQMIEQIENIRWMAESGRYEMAYAHAMQEFFKDKPPVHYDDCVLIFRHVYDRERPERLNRDHDNIEVNIVADIVALYTMPDDGPSVCDHYYCSAAAAEDRTEIYVVPRDDFPQWLVVEETMPDDGVELHDTAGN